MKGILCYIISLALCAGCINAGGKSTSPDDGSIEVSGVILPPESQIDVVKQSGQIVFRDAHVSIVGTQNGGINSMAMDNADIRDLSAFAISIYRNQLQARIQKGEPLSMLDKQLLEFAWMANCEALKTFALFAQDNIITGGVYWVEKTPSSIDLTFSADVMSVIKEYIRKAIITFGSNSNALAKKIDLWASDYRGIDGAVIRADLLLIEDANSRPINEKQTRTYNNAIVEYLNLLNRYGPSFFPIQLLHVLHSKGIDFSPDRYVNRRLIPYREYNVDKQLTANRWIVLFNSQAFYVDDLRVIYDDTALFLKESKDSTSKRFVEDFRMNLEEDLRRTTRSYRIVFCDFPFAVACFRAYSGIQEAKGLFNDDEDAMRQQLNDFNQRVYGTKMLLNISSPYTAKLYSQLLELAKSELGDKEWNTLRTELKLYELDDLSFASPDSLFRENSFKKEH